MIPIDRTKTAVDPYKLALETMPRFKVDYNPYVRYGSSALEGLHGISDNHSGLAGLAGIFDDLLHYGEKWLDNQFESTGLSQNDIVPVQNRVSDAMNQLSASYYPLRDSGQVTVALISQYQQAMQNLVNSFCSYAQRLGTVRAADGCKTIQYWGGRWIQDREAEKSAVSGGVSPTTGTVITDPITGQPITIKPPAPAIGMLSFGSVLPMVLLGLGVFAFFKSSKRW